MNWNQTELVASQTVLASGVGRQNFPHPAQVASPHRCPTVGTGTSMNCIVMVIGISCSLVMVIGISISKRFSGMRFYPRLSGLQCCQAKTDALEAIDVR